MVDWVWWRAGEDFQFGLWGQLEEGVSRDHSNRRLDKGQSKCHPNLVRLRFRFGGDIAGLVPSFRFPSSIKMALLCSVYLDGKTKAQKHIPLNRFRFIFRFPLMWLYWAIKYIVKRVLLLFIKMIATPNHPRLYIVGFLSSTRRTQQQHQIMLRFLHLSFDVRSYFPKFTWPRISSSVSS